MASFSAGRELRRRAEIATPSAATRPRTGPPHPGPRAGCRRGSRGLGTSGGAKEPSRKAKGLAVGAREPRRWSKKPRSRSPAAPGARQKALRLGPASPGAGAKSPGRGTRQLRARGQKPCSRGLGAPALEQKTPMAKPGSSGRKARSLAVGAREPRYRSALQGGTRDRSASSGPGRRALGAGRIPRPDVLSGLGSWHIPVPLAPCPQDTTSSGDVVGVASLDATVSPEGANATVSPPFPSSAGHAPATTDALL